MPHIVHLPLTTEDFRQHPALEAEPRHWLLDSVYGRQLLKAKLREVRPDVNVVLVRQQRELDPMLNTIIDSMDLREWPKPRTISERVMAFRMQLRMAFEIESGGDVPSWRTA